MLIAGLDEQDLDFESSHILNLLSFRKVKGRVKLIFVKIQIYQVKN